MINRLKVLAFVPARGGSKGIKNKNTRVVNSKPLIFYTIKAAKESKFVDDVFVSTDSECIAKISRQNKATVPFLRPKTLAQDKSNIIDSLIYSLKQLKKTGKNYDIIVVLQPTSPLRTSLDIDGALKVFVRTNRSIASINEINVNPFLIRTITGTKLKKLLNSNSTIRRQDLDKYYKVNGAIYINWTKQINKTTSLNDNEVGYVLPLSHSLDIDTIDDLISARKILRSKNKNWK